MNDIEFHWYGFISLHSSHLIMCGSPNNLRYKAEDSISITAKRVLR